MVPFQPSMALRPRNIEAKSTKSCCIGVDLLMISDEDVLVGQADYAVGSPLRRCQAQFC
jgi:hypothetical protein